MAVQIARAARKPAISSELYPSSRSTASVSAPISRGGCSIEGPPCANLNAAQRHAERAVDAWRRVEFVKDAAGREMRIGEGFRHRAHPCGGHMPRLEIGFPL